MSLLGTGASPAVAFSPTSLTFSTQTVGTTSAPQTVTLTNMGSVTLAITRLPPAPNSVDQQLRQLPDMRTACTINVTFTPAATGTTTGTISVVDNVAGSPHTVSLTGTGAGAATITLTPTALTFANQGVNTASAKKPVTLKNTGAGPLTVTSIVTTGSYSQTNTCGVSVAAGATCTISVGFTPTVVGANPGTVSITDNAANSPQSVSLTGTGTATNITFAPTSLNFGNQALNVKSAAQAVKLTNKTAARLTFTKIVTSANYSQTNNCGAGVAANASCTVNVSFTPTTAGTIGGTLTFTDSGSGLLQTVPLSGTGISATVVFSPTSVTFANQSVGSSSPGYGRDPDQHWGGRVNHHQCQRHWNERG